MNASDNYTLLIDKINIFIKKYYLNNLLRGLIFLGAGLFSAYVAITVTEYYGNFNPLARSILFYSFIVLNLGLIVWLVVPSLMAWLKLGKTITHDQAAEIIGKHFNDVNDKLLNTLQLKKLSSQDAQHQDLIMASIDQKIEKLQPVRFPTAINIRDNRKYLKWALIPLGIICIIGFAAPSILTESTKRLIRHNEYFAPVAPFKFVVQNRVLSVVQGDDLKLDIKLEGNSLPADVYVETANNTFKLDKENVTKFHYLFSNLQQNTKFRLVGNGFTSVPYEIKVNLRPSLLHFDVILNYPGYLNKKNEVLPNAGDLTLPAGTTVTWRFHTQNATGMLFDMNTSRSALTSAGKDLFEHRERVITNSVYKITPLNSLVNHSDSALYRINVIADEAPSIGVQEKPDSVSLRAIYFTGKAQDDHGFSSLNFHYTIKAPGGNKAQDRTFNKAVKADLGQTQADFFYLWNLKELGINPGDHVSYYFEVADNDGVSGPKKARTPEQQLNIPDEQELNEQLNKSTEIIKQKMQSASKIAGQIEKEAQKMNQMLLNKNSLSFDEKKQVMDMLQKRQELDELVKDIQAENKKNLYNRQESQDQQKDLVEQQKMMEKLLNDVLDPKTREMLDRLQDLLKNDQKDNARQELSKMQQDNKSMKRELDRMLELYKKLDFQQKLNQQINQLNKLAEKQEDLADKTDKKPADQQAKKNEANKNQQQNKEQTQAQKDQQAKQDQAAKEEQAKLEQAIKDLQAKLNQAQKDQQAKQDQAKKDQQQGKQQTQAQKDQKAKLEQAIKDLQAKIDQAKKDQQQAMQDQAKKDQQQGKQQDQAQKDQGDQQLAKDEQQALQKEQEKLKEEFEDIAKNLDKLDKENEEAKQDFDQPKAEEEDVKEEMQKSKEQLSKNNRKQSAQSQKQAAQKMKQMAQKMQEQNEQEQEEQNLVDEHLLREILKSLVNSSFNQEKIMERLRNTSQIDPAYVTLAQSQKAIKDNLKTAEDSLYALSKRIPQIQKSVNTEIASINSRIDEALTSLGDRRTAEANRSQQYAMTSMNNLALMLSEALNNLQASADAKPGKGKPGKGKPKQPSLSQLSKQQQQLNQNMQKAREQMRQQQQQGQQQGQQQQGQQQGQQGQQNRVPGDRNANGNMSEQLAKLAREQQLIRQQFEQLAREAGKAKGSAIPNADKIAKEMEQTETDLVNRRINDESLKRQLQIQTRLLEAEKAEQEREQDQQRQSQVGKDMPPGYIKALQDYQQKKAKQTEQIRTVPPNLNLYYKTKIKNYFEQINAK